MQISDTPPHHHAGPATLAPIPFAVYCGATTIQELVVRDLEQQGCHYDPAAEIVLVLELPYSFAWALVERLTALGHRVIVVTWNDCPEYCDTLWDLGPHVLLAGTTGDPPLATTIADVAQGRRFRHAAVPSSPLTVRERRILHLLALGHSDRQIADQTGLQRQTVRNTMTTVYQKLDLPDSKAALLYYWNIWPARDRFPKKMQRRRSSS